MSVRPIPDTLTEILVKLELIARLQPNQKLNICSSTYADAANRSFLGYLMGVWHRKYYNEGRTSLLLHLQKVINNGIAALQEFPDFRSDLITSLNSVSIGLSNLMITYANDPDVTARIAVLIREIARQLQPEEGHYTGKLPIIGYESTDCSKESGMGSPSVRGLGTPSPAVNGTRGVNEGVPASYV